MNPIPGMRAPVRPAPRKHLLPDEVAVLLRTAADQIGVAEVPLAADPDNRARGEGLFVAEQTQLLVRLAADSAARRGELASLRLGGPGWPGVDDRTEPVTRGAGPDQDRSAPAVDDRGDNSGDDP